jgi:hypothetical protein
MDPRTAATRVPDPDAVEFIRFCYRRRRVGWPELYDEMCAVAARGRFRGMGPDELAGLGIGFSLFDMPALAGLAATVIAEEQAKRRPVAVAIVAEPVAFEIEPAVISDAETPSIAADPLATATPAVERTAEPTDDRSIDVPIRLAPVAAGA